MKIKVTTQKQLEHSTTVHAQWEGSMHMGMLKGGFLHERCGLRKKEGKGKSN